MATLRPGDGRSPFEANKPEDGRLADLMDNPASTSQPPALDSEAAPLRFPSLPAFTLPATGAPSPLAEPKNSQNPGFPLFLPPNPGVALTQLTSLRDLDLAELGAFPQPKRPPQRPPSAQSMPPLQPIPASNGNFALPAPLAASTPELGLERIPIEEGLWEPSQRRRRKVRQPGEIVKGPWRWDEDELLIKLVQEQGANDHWGSWTRIAESLPWRTGKQCRDRWMSNLNPNIKKAPWTPEEDTIIIDCWRKWGCSWSRIATLLPGRPPPHVKNRWYGSLRFLVEDSTDKKRRRAKAAAAEPSPSNSHPSELEMAQILEEGFPPPRKGAAAVERPERPTRKTKPSYARLLADEEDEDEPSGPPAGDAE